MKNRNATRLNPGDEVRREASPVTLVILGLICAICFASAAFAQNRYQITRIPMAQGANSSALGINNKGEVVGYSFQGEDYRAFLYSSSDQSLTDVGSLGGKINAACAISDAGQVTGYSQDRNGNLLAFVYSRKQPIASLGTLDGASTSEAFGINNSGAVVGDSQSGNQSHRPVLFSNGSVQDLGLGGSNESDAFETAFAIDDAGQIVGRHSAGNNAFHAFVFSNGSTTDLSTLGGANGEALAINKHGLVVGDSDTADGPAHAFVFDHSQVKDLGALPGFDNASFARGINSSGDIVGESDSADQKRAFLYTKGQLVELDKLAENLSEVGFVSLDVAYGINDKGWIVGYGTTSDNLTAAFIAVPEGHGNRARAVPRQPPVSESNEQNYDVFYNRLSSDEGSWVEAGDYGYCFRPRVSEDWRPYQDGHWVWTDRGWYWDSNERFGWATYHYGRWADIAGTGWCWVPGNQWAPAWVSWRESDEDVGWAPLPPEATVSEYPSISSWSDAYYGIGPAAYVFINYSHWHEPSYAQYIEPPQRNVQIINETKNVTNIVTNNNVINNFGPPVQTVATRTNQNIQQVKLAVNPATDPYAKYGQTLQGNQLNVVAPPATLKPQATQAPPVQSRIENPQVQKGWQGVKPQEAALLKKTIAEQNPAPKDLPKPTPFVNPQFGNKGQVTGSPGATASPGVTGSPPAGIGQKLPPNFVKPGVGSPNAKVVPGASPNAAGVVRRSVPPNLLGVKPSGTPGGSPTGTGGKPPAPGASELKKLPSGNVPGGLPNAPKGTPPNLNVPKPSATPGQPTIPGNQPVVSPTARPAGNLPPGQITPRVSATPGPAASPTQEKKLQATPAPTLHGGPANPTTPKPAPEIKAAPQEVAPPKPTPVSTPHREPAATPKPTPEIKTAPQEVAPPKPTPVSTPRREPAAAPKPTPEVKAAPPEVAPPKPAPVSTPHREPAAAPKPAPEKKASPPAKQESKTPPPQVQHAPATERRVVHTPPAQPPPQKPKVQQQVVHQAHPAPPSPPHIAQAPHPPPPPHVAQASQPQPPPHVAQAPHPQPPPPHVAQAPHPPPPPPPHVAQAPHPQPQPHPAPSSNKDEKKKNPPQK
jgi:probable HAF family extracellular repeat protein